MAKDAWSYDIAFSYMKIVDVHDDSISYLDVCKHLNIKKGDILFVASDIKRLFFDETRKTGIFPNANDFIDSIITLVGEEGTVILPTYNWGFCKGETFDWKKTKGKTGSLGNVCLKRADFKRTKHAIYSCVVWGKYQNYLCENDYVDSFGPNSILEFLYKKKAKQLLIDTDLLHGFTFVHYVEEMSGLVHYRYLKNFTSLYIDEKGNEQDKTYSMNVRDLNLDVTNDLYPIERDFIESGIVEKTVINEIPYLLVPNIAETYEPILYDIKFNRSKKIVKFKGQ